MEEFKLITGHLFCGFEILANLVGQLVRSFDGHLWISVRCCKYLFFTIWLPTPSTGSCQHES